MLDFGKLDFGKLESGSNGIVHDVIVVGQGPVGQIVAGLLAARGHSVVGLEKHRTPYRLPRAVHLTAESLRTVDAIGAAVEWPRFAEAATGPADFLDADHDVLLRIPLEPGVPQGWPADLSLSQPDFEQVLRERVAELATLQVVSDADVVAVDDTPDGVVATHRDSRGRLSQVTARYLVACDGSNSFVRSARAIPMVDTGFNADWLVVDLRPSSPDGWDGSVFSAAAQVTQVCDPARPTTFVDSGPGRKRFEFMRVSGDDAEQLASPESAWSLLAPFGYTARNSTLEKNTLYTFRARWAGHWVDSRVLLAGDAAHQMPPMGGVGLVSGIRDAANLAWKLHLVLGGVADAALLDTYWTERSAHVESAISRSVDWGRLVCEIDPAAAARRDGMLRELGLAALPPPVPERLGVGVQPPAEMVDQRFVGTPSAHGRLRLPDGTVALADRLADGGFTLLFDGTRINAAAASELVATLPAALSVAAFLISDDGASRGAGSLVAGAVDVDGVYRERFADTGALLEVVRPDSYVYGLAADLDVAARLVRSLPAALCLPPSAVSPRAVAARA